MRNRTILGDQFEKSIEQQVWEKGQIVAGKDPSIYRKDKCGAWMKRDLHRDGATTLSLEWEIDHIKPQAKDGKDDLPNLQPLQWENNRYKGDNFPASNRDCKVTADYSDLTNRNI